MDKINTLSSDETSGRILVVDDDPDIAQMTALMLALCGYEVKEARDGRQAIETARTFRPALVILDIDMPVMDGYEAAAALRREQAGDLSPVLVAYTARKEPADLERALQAGFDHCLPKPDAGDLCALVARFLVRGNERGRYGSGDAGGDTAAP